MRYADGFRQPAAAESLLRALHAVLADMRGRADPLRVMEVCGTHTMAVGRHGLRKRLPHSLRLISGPGCPVCVTDSGYLEAALALTARGVAIATFGDLLHVPTANGDSLAACRSRGGRVQVCYSPLDAVRLAAAEPSREWVFLAIGFETTIAPVLAALERAEAAGVRNLTVLVAFKRVLPAMEAVLAGGAAIDGFLCPPHVSTVIGAAAYRSIAERYRRPCVVAGFEPLDILVALVELARLIVADRPAVVNEYDRVVTEQGNPRAQRLIEAWLEPCVARWRGLGDLPDSGYRLRRERAVRFDAELRHGVRVGTGREVRGCRCGEVIAGRLDPPECPLFARKCTPDSPVGPCMVSSEGSCAAWFKYERAEEPSR
ncbi:MAG: hydrogenase formation protein HypD [Kiritimatiellae bacterium]|nr:hydrogenase formation protein HypD [Kiritimatiellia bacterium]